MKRTSYAVFALLAAVLAIAVAGCGGGGDNSSNAYGGGESGESSSGGGRAYGSGESTTASNEGGEGGAFVSLGNAGDLGMVLVDSKGMTLYDFHKDKGTASSCYGACAEAWPPVLTEGAPKPSNGTDASLLGVTTRKDGTEQATYDGHPLYGFVGDKKPGEANGNDVSAFGGQWYALKGSGKEAGG